MKQEMVLRCTRVIQFHSIFISCFLTACKARLVLVRWAHLHLSSWNRGCHISCQTIGATDAKAGLAICMVRANRVNSVRWIRRSFSADEYLFTLWWCSIKLAPPLLEYDTKMRFSMSLYKAVYETNEIDNWDKISQNWDITLQHLHLFYPDTIE